MSSSEAEVMERIAEQYPARGIPFLINLENLRSNLADHRQRVRDSHLMGAKAMGLDGLVGKSKGREDDMGDIVVTGDITNSGGAPAGTPGWLGPVLAALGIAAGVPGGMMLNSMLNQDKTPAAVVAPATDTELGTSLSVERGGALTP